MKRIIIAILAAAILASCSRDTEFTVEGTLVDGSTMNMRAVYYDNGQLQTSVFPADKGHFAFKGKTTEGSVVELLTNDYRLIGRFFAGPGDEIKLTVDPRSPSKIKVEGNDIAQRWAQLTTANARLLDSRDKSAVDAFVAKYAAAHPDDMVSTLLLLTSYDFAGDPAGAERILAKIDPEARPAWLVDSYTLNLQRVGKQAAEARALPFSYIDERDSLQTFNPRRQRTALLVFSDEYCGRTDSVVPALRRIAAKWGADAQVRLLDFSLDGDTLTWRRGLRADSLDKVSGIRHGWVAGSVAAPAIEKLGIPRLPYYIIVDSTGRQTYRSSSAPVSLP